MLRIERTADGEDVRFAISGRVEAVHAAELERLIGEEIAAHRSVVLDLIDVKLVDREAMSFFAHCEATGIRLEHCPAYVREWMSNKSEVPRKN